MSAVELLVKKLTLFHDDFELAFSKEINKAKEMEEQKAHEYAEFAIRCDRKGMKILNFNDWIKL